MPQEEIISIVQHAWCTIPHERFAEKGYKQTGPALPMPGAISQGDPFKELLRVWEIIDPSTSPTQVGTKMRDDAIAFVQKGYDDQKWTVWADCHILIDEQDGVADATPEGMEAFGVEPHGKTTNKMTPMGKMAIAKMAKALGPIRNTAVDLMNPMDQMSVTITMMVMMEVMEVTGLPEALAALSSSKMRGSQMLRVQRALVPCQLKLGKLPRMRHLQMLRLRI